jgi:hypothetical protein
MNHIEFSAHPVFEAKPSAMQDAPIASGDAKPMLAETVRYDPAPEREGVIAARERQEPEGPSVGSEINDAETLRAGFDGARRSGVTGRRDAHFFSGPMP